MIVSSVTFDEWDCRIRVHRPKGFAFLYEHGVILGQFRFDSVGRLVFNLEKGRQLASNRLIILLDVVRSML